MCSRIMCEHCKTNQVASANVVGGGSGSGGNEYSAEVEQEVTELTSDVLLQHVLTLQSKNRRSKR